MECYNSSTMSTNTLVYFALASSGIALFLGVYSAIASGQLKTLRKYFRKENQPENLDEIVEQIIEKLTQLDDHAKATSENLDALTKQLSTATQHVGLIRYNSNGDDGGNLSFSAAILDAHQSGIVLTSLHGRQNNRIYAKVITEGVSESTLSEEEQEAIINALTKKPN
jgi:TATA-binding protein-associated factor Taf7